MTTQAAVLGVLEFRKSTAAQIWLVNRVLGSVLFGKSAPSKPMIRNSRADIASSGGRGHWRILVEYGLGKVWSQC